MIDEQNYILLRKTSRKHNRRMKNISSDTTCDLNNKLPSIDLNNNTIDSFHPARRPSYTTTFKGSTSFSSNKFISKIGRASSIRAANQFLNHSNSELMQDIDKINSYGVLQQCHAKILEIVIRAIYGSTATNNVRSLLHLMKVVVTKSRLPSLLQVNMIIFVIQFFLNRNKITLFLFKNEFSNCKNPSRIFLSHFRLNLISILFLLLTHVVHVEWFVLTFVDGFIDILCFFNLPCQ